MWSYDHEEFASAFTARTRMVLLNTPHNPTGKVFTVAELERIAETVCSVGRKCDCEWER